MASSITPEKPEKPEKEALLGTRLGNYRLVRLLGRGRMGVVYLADDLALLRPTAVKVLSWMQPAVAGQDPVEWFLSEARLVARINHPRVVQIYGAAQAGSVFYIAMEYVPGVSAEALLAEGPLAPQRAVEIALHVAAALQAAHRVGVVHRDVKPANVLLGQDGLAKLGDFGMALTAQSARAAPQLRAGTPLYLAPEVWQGAPATAASDLYSLGATLFHLLTGQPPFPGPGSAEVERGHLRGPVPDPRDLRPGLPASSAALLRRMLGKAPEQRHQSAEVLQRELLRLHRELVGAARAPRSGSQSLLVADEPLPEEVAAAPEGPALQTTSEVGAWLRARLAASAAPVRLTTPDAVRLLASRAGGERARVQLLAENALLLAAREGARVLSARHVWAASGLEQWTAAPPAALRAAARPPAAFFEALDACRKEAGVSPFPRAGNASFKRSSNPTE